MVSPFQPLAIALEVGLLTRIRDVCIDCAALASNAHNAGLAGRCGGIASAADEGLADIEGFPDEVGPALSNCITELHDLSVKPVMSEVRKRLDALYSLVCGALTEFARLVV